MPATPVRSRFPNVGSPPPFGSVAPWPMTLSVHSGAFSRASRFADAYCGRTFVQSHCNSSQTIMALEVQTPWPSSVWAMRIVTVSSGAMTIQALISGVAGSSYQDRAGRRLRVRSLRHPEAEHEGSLGCGDRRKKLATVDAELSHASSRSFIRSAARWMACLTRWYVPQRQALVTCASMSASEGSGAARSRASALMIIPDWQ